MRGGARACGSTRGVAPFPVKNRPETGKRTRRSFPAAAGWFFRPRPHAEEHRSPASSNASTVRLRCDASRSMRGIAAHPSRRAHARPDLRQHFRTRAPQDEAAQGIPSPRLVVEPSSVIPISRCQTAHRVPAAHVCVRGLRFRFTHPQRGWAERRQTFGCSAEHPLGVHVTRHARRLRGALRPITRDARLSALHRGGF